MIIQFICRGNAFRSIIAEAYLNAKVIPGLIVVSSGTVAGAHKKANASNFLKTLALLKKHGIAQFAKDHHADNIEQSLVDKSDIVVCLNQAAYDEAANLCTLPKKTYIWDVTDIGEGSRVAANDAERELYAEAVYAEITAYVDDLLRTTKLR